MRHHYRSFVNSFNLVFLSSEGHRCVGGAPEHPGPLGGVPRNLACPERQRPNAKPKAGDFQPVAWGNSTVLDRPTSMRVPLSGHAIRDIL